MLHLFDLNVTVLLSFINVLCFFIFFSWLHVLTFFLFFWLTLWESYICLFTTQWTILALCLFTDSEEFNFGVSYTACWRAQLFQMNCMSFSHPSLSSVFHPLTVSFLCPVSLL
ncbi:hypothetical protein FKM82_013404 [Ascaphus truei]